MKEAIYCHKCSHEIKKREKLAVAGLLFLIAPYHEGCFAKELKGPASLFMRNQPVNSIFGTVFAIISFFLLAGVLILTEGYTKLFSIFFVFPIVFRLLSYLLYERYIPR